MVDLGSGLPDEPARCGDPGGHHTTQRHLSFLEQGRSKPGRTMVLRLAESLDLTLRERNELLLVAGYAPAFPESDLEASSLDEIDALARHMVTHDVEVVAVAQPVHEDEPIPKLLLSDVPCSTPGHEGST